MTTLLHDVGAIVWHNAPRLRNAVITDPQWFADAMAGVVSFVSQGVASCNGGITNWARMQDSLKLKYAVGA